MLLLHQLLQACLLRHVLNPVLQKLGQQICRRQRCLSCLPGCLECGVQVLRCGLMACMYLSASPPDQSQSRGPEMPDL